MSLEAHIWGVREDVVMTFSKATGCLVMTVQEAREVANLLLKIAQEIEESKPCRKT